MDLRTSESLGLAISSSLLQLTGEPISEERSTGFSGVACRAAVEIGRFIMYTMLPRRLDTCGEQTDVRSHIEVSKDQVLAYTQWLPH